MYKRLKTLLKEESGYASFVIVLVTMIVVSLIVVAFASDSRLEQKNSLANTEAVQAYYAAESGINDAAAVIGNYISAGQSVPSTNNSCANATNNPQYIANGGTNNSNNLNGTNVEYTCLIVNPSPNSIEKQNLAPGVGWVVPLNNSGGIGSITISWEDSTKDPSSLGFASCLATVSSPSLQLPKGTDYPPASGCGAGVLQVDLLSGSQLGSEIGSSSTWSTSNATTVFLEPLQNNTGSASNSTTDLTSAPAGQAQAIYVSCNSTNPQGEYACTTTLTVNSDDNYYLHVQDFYQTSDDVQITAQANPSGSNLPISGDQVLIDSTGEANGQLKRIQERICDNAYCGNAVLSPDAAIVSTQCVNKAYPVDPSESPPYNPDGPPASPPC